MLRPTSSARRQWAAALVAEDVEHVDHAADEERPELKLSSHVRKVQKFGRSALEIEGIVVATGLSHLISCSLDTGDMGLIFAFADKWHKETSSFHLLVGEVTITLNDVASFLHLPITGAFHTFNALHVDQAMDLLVELLKVSTQEAKDDTFQCHGAYFCLAWLRDIYRSKCDAGQWTVAARAYPLYLVGCTLFSNKSVTHVPVIFLYAFRDLGQIGSYSWGAAALVHMYENLNDASKKTVRQLVGYITLQHCWIYKYFSTVALCVADEDYHEKKPRGCCWKFGKALLVSTYHKWLDRLMSGTVCWIPYGDHRAFREFELISLFFGQIRWGQSIVIQ
ncbi:protein MAIN-LIKE 2-like [Glycine max]|uniref:protein MAIN-LIKE 2-like n=1 Tax=Glycine max TaxID=3847 RepID=UPI0003DEB5D9|nr:protein MAIN-LIKE 2-like [Glycine max]